MKNQNNGFRDVLRWAEEQDAYWIEAVKLEFTEELCAEMARQGVSRADLARRLGTSAAYVTKVLGGATNFTLESMTRIARALGCELRTHLQPPGAKAAWLDYRCSPEEPAATRCGAMVTWELRDTQARASEVDLPQTEVA